MYRWKCPWHLSSHPLNENNILCLYLRQRVIAKYKQDKTFQRALKRTPYQSTVIATNIVIFMLPDTKKHSQILFLKLSLLLVMHFYFILFYEKQCKQNIYFQRHIRNRIWRQKYPRASGEKGQALHLWDLGQIIKLSGFFILHLWNEGLY